MRGAKRRVRFGMRRSLAPPSCLRVSWSARVGQELGPRPLPYTRGHILFATTWAGQLMENTTDALRTCHFGALGVRTHTAHTAHTPHSSAQPRARHGEAHVTRRPAGQ